MFGLGIWELIVILGIVVILFGAKRLPMIGEGLGGLITNFKKASKRDEPENSPIQEETQIIEEEGKKVS